MCTQLDFMAKSYPWPCRVPHVLAEMEEKRWKRRDEMEEKRWKDGKKKLRGNKWMLRWHFSMYPSCMCFCHSGKHWSN